MTLDTRGGADVRSSALARVRLPAILGGVLWMVYGVLEMLAPWGVDAVYDERRGHDVVVDRLLFTFYSLPGALALVLGSIALLGLLRVLRLRGRGALAAAAVALGLGVVSVLGIALGFDPLFTAPRIFGTLALGVAAAVAARGGSRERLSSWPVVLALLGVSGIALLPLWPLVHALGWLTPAMGAAIIAAHGALWVAAGLHRLPG